MLIETDWLFQHLDEINIRIVDLRSREKYDKGHIRNAVYLNFIDITGDETVSRELPPENTSDILGDLRIDRDTLVIAYDDDLSHWDKENIFIFSTDRNLNGDINKQKTVHK